MRRSISLAVVAALAAGPGLSLGQVPAVPGAATSEVREIKKEFMGDVVTPHGELVLPVPTSPDAKRGLILNLSDGRLHVMPVMPEGAAKPTMLDVLNNLRKTQTGDLLYSNQDGGSLLVIGGRFTDMGNRYYKNLINGELPTPRDVPAPKPSDPGSLPGTINPVVEGHIYLVATVDGHYAAIRVLEKQTDGLLIQYVYQPANSLNFWQPEQPLLPLHGPPIVTASSGGGMGTAPLPKLTDLGPRPAPTVLDKPSADPMRTVLEPMLSSHLMQRQRLIQTRVEILSNISTSDEAIAKKITAIDELGQMRAVEAMGVLLDNIGIMDPHGSDKPFSVENYHPAVGALRAIGKPASLAAIQAINQMDPSAGATVDGLQKADFRIRLLALVVVGVEGQDEGEFMLNKAMEKADAGHKAMFEKAVKYLRLP